LPVTQSNQSLGLDAIERAAGPTLGNVFEQCKHATIIARGQVVLCCRHCSSFPSHLVCSQQLLLAQRDFQAHSQLEPGVGRKLIQGDAQALRDLVGEQRLCRGNIAKAEQVVGTLRGRNALGDPRHCDIVAYIIIGRSAIDAPNELRALATFDGLQHLAPNVGTVHERSVRLRLDEGSIARELPQQCFGILEVRDRHAAGLGQNFQHNACIQPSDGKASCACCIARRSSPGLQSSGTASEWRSTRACTVSAISSHRGASIGASMAGWSCRSRRCNRASVMVTRLDRLARSTRDLLNTLTSITGKGAGWGAANRSSCFESTFFERRADP
jgi:hypothetical protein